MMLFEILLTLMLTMLFANAFVIQFDEEVVANDVDEDDECEFEFVLVDDDVKDEDEVDRKYDDELLNDNWFCRS